MTDLGLGYARRHSETPEMALPVNPSTPPTAPTIVIGRPCGFAKVVYGLTILSTVLGCVVGIGGFALASGAPQEASAASLGCLIVIAGYVFARAVDFTTR